MERIYSGCWRTEELGVRRLDWPVERLKVGKLNIECASSNSVFLANPLLRSFSVMPPTEK
jgi:hypothetical protein